MKTILITGVSSGFGRALAEAALVDGHRVVGTLRDASAVAEFERLKPGAAFARVLDVTDTPAIVPTIEGIENDIGPSTFSSTTPAMVSRAQSRRRRSTTFAGSSTSTCSGRSP